MSWTVEFSPLVPYPLLIAAAVLAALLSLALLWRRTRGAPLRILSLLALLAALSNPTLRQEVREGLSNIALIAVDRSVSQSLAGRRALTDAAQKALTDRLGQIDNLDVRIVEAGVAAENQNTGTNLFGDISRALAAIPADRLAGVVVLTDGQVHDVPATAAALGIETPVHALLTGAEGEFDRRIAVLKAPRFGLVGSSASAEIKVEAHGVGAEKAGTAQLRIRREGEPDQSLTVNVGVPVSIPITFPHAGQNIVEVELAPVPGELSEANNRAILVAEGVRENLRVLLVSGEPHAGERTWRNLLKSDAAVDLVHFTILRPPQKQDGTPINELSLIAFPTRELFQEKIEEFDLIIFDRYQRLGILPPIYIDNIARYVEDHGGAVLVSAGAEYAEPGSIYNSPLAQVLPAEPTGQVREEPFKPMLTDAGQRHPVTRELPGADASSPAWGRWFRLVDVANPQGHALMKGPDDKPVVLLDRKGKGRVALILSDHTWLWARGLEGGGPYEALLRRLGHWLMKEPDLEEEHLSAKTAGLKITIERRTMGETVPPVALQSADGKTRDVTLSLVRPGLWQGVTTVDEPGFYKLAQDKLTAVALAGNQMSREMAEVTTTADKLAPLLTSAGGGSYYLRDRPGTAPASPSLPRISMLKSAKLMHGSGWMGLADREAHVTKGVTLTPLVTGFAALAALLGLMSLAWWREGR